MLRRPHSAPLTDTPFPYPTLFRSCPLALGCDGADIMPCIVKAGPEEVVHGRVNDDEWLRRALLHPDDLRQQGACIADDHPAGLEQQPDAPVRCDSDRKSVV